jgi:hypothetical protein
MDIGLFEVVIGGLLSLLLLFIIVSTWLGSFLNLYLYDWSPEPFRRGLFQLCVVLIQTTSPYPVVTRSKNEKYFFDCDSGKRIQFPSLEDPWSVHLSVIVPAYDEAQRCKALHMFYLFYGFKYQNSCFHSCICQYDLT